MSGDKLIFFRCSRSDTFKQSGWYEEQQERRGLFSRIFTCKSEWIITIDYSRVRLRPLVCNELESPAPPVARLSSVSSF